MVEKLGIKQVKSYDMNIEDDFMCYEKDVRAVEKQRDELLAALIEEMLVTESHDELKDCDNAWDGMDAALTSSTGMTFYQIKKILATHSE